MRRTDVGKRKQAVAVIVCVFCILYITLFSRIPTLTRVTHLVTFWSYASHGHWKQILLNVALFIPIGYFLSQVLIQPRNLLLSALAVSACIELLQFFTYRGMADVDDLISNCCGVAIGLGIYRLSSRYKWKRVVPAIMIAAVFVGSAMTAVSAANRNIETKITQQFDFRIGSVDEADHKTVLRGSCSLYDRKTPEYSIFIGDTEATVVLDGNQYTAEIGKLSGKAEVRVKFKGYPAMPTGMFLRAMDNGVSVEYVDGLIPEISGLPETAVLKARNTEYDVLVYEDCDRLLWLIGSEIDKNTEIIYHIHTNEPEKLPERRVQYGFDNRGFRVGDEQAENELEGIDHYRVFEKEIPEEYHVTAIVVGFNTDGTITWTESFRPT